MDFWISFPVLLLHVYKSNELMVRLNASLQVQCVAESPTELSEWSGWVSSRLRRLVNKLSEIAEVRLWPHEFTPSEKTPQGLCQSWFWIGVKRPHFMPPKNGKDNPTINMSHPIMEFRRLVIDGYKSHIKSGMMVYVCNVKQHELPDEYFTSGVNPARCAEEVLSTASLQPKGSVGASEEVLSSPPAGAEIKGDSLISQPCSLPPSNFYNILRSPSIDSPKRSL